MTNIVQFAEARVGRNLERVRSTYSVRDIHRQFGISEHFIRRWTKEGFIQTAEGSAAGELRYAFRSLKVFRHLRELRSRGLSMRQVESELCGQLNLFFQPEGRLIPLPRKLSPFEEAMLLHDQQDQRAAELYLVAALQGDHAPDAYCNLGILEFEAGEVVSAFDRFTQALRYDPRHFESHFNLAHLYFESGDLRLARLHYEIAAAIEPNVADLYYNLGLVHAINGELEASIAALSQARELVSDDEGAKVEALLSTVENALGIDQGSPDP